MELISHRREPSERVSGLDHETARRTGQTGVGFIKVASRDQARLSAPAGWLASRAAHRRAARPRPRAGDHWQTIRSGRRAAGWADVDGVAVAQPPPLGQSLAEKVTVALVSWSDPVTTYPSGGVMRAAALTAYWPGWHG